jgi:chromate transport protein ChrA
MIRQQTKGGVPKTRNCASEFCEDVGASLGATDNNHGSRVARTALAANITIELGISNEDKCTWWKVVVMNVACVVAFKFKFKNE